jgi:Protein of unknown function (DUF3768)
MRDDFAFSSDRVTRIAQLNDTLRQTLQGGRILFIRGVNALGPSICSRIIAALGEFNDFRRHTDDPFGEHDFGAFEVLGHRLFFKIDYYDHGLTAASSDPSDPAITVRVLTVLLPEEY